MSRLTRVLSGVALLAVAGTLLFAAGCGGTTDRVTDARKAVVGWTTALTKRNFYDACAFEAYDGKQNPTEATVKTNYGGKYTARRFCATQWASSGFTGDVQTISGTPVTSGLSNEDTYTEFIAAVAYQAGEITNAQYKAILKAAQPHKIKLTVPKNGYVFKITSDGYRVYIGVQRDQQGTWRIVSVRA